MLHRVSHCLFIIFLANAIIINIQKENTCFNFPLEFLHFYFVNQLNTLKIATDQSISR